MKLSLQEWYALLVRTSAEGGFPAVVPGTTLCRYRTPDGRRCAVGLLLSEEDYEEKLEGDLIVWPPQLFDKVMPWGATLCDLTRVQTAHDSIAQQGRAWSHTEFVRKLRQLGCFRDCKEEKEEEGAA